MANPHANGRRRHLAAVLLVFLLLTSSSARPLNDYFSHAATEPTLNLSLPSDRVVVVVPPEEEVPAGHVSTCGHGRVAGKLPLPGTRLAGGKYGPLILNMLPKGPVPPSGPSKGTNSINN
ncbi:hypothetical protein E2542_SST02693 [Spatholobus suberectus]|nr:hypothetical protein E2542_SST02693 [Spatholobus suberectus]